MIMMMVMIEGMYSDVVDVVSSPDAINAPCALRKATNPQILLQSS